MKRFIVLFLSTTLLAACTPSLSVSAQSTSEPYFVTATLPPTQTPWPTSDVIPVTPTSTTDPSIFTQLFPGSNAGNELTRMDEQGMVIVEVTPANLGMPGDTLIFEVAMNTHSVDLSMDLAPLAILTTDAGKAVHATVWDAPRGGHHVSGSLIFPYFVDGIPFLDGATKVVLEIQDVDVPVRTFEWQLQ